jgi:hypothetical protein
VAETPQERRERSDKLNLTEQQIQDIEKYASLALRIADIAYILGMCERTLYRRINENDELRVRLLKGKAATKARLNRTLINKALDGKDTAALIFACKTISGLVEPKESDYDDNNEQYDLPESLKK